MTMTVRLTNSYRRYLGRRGTFRDFEGTMPDGAQFWGMVSQTGRRIDIEMRRRTARGTMRVCDRRMANAWLDVARAYAQSVGLTVWDHAEDNFSTWTLARSHR